MAQHIFIQGPLGAGKTLYMSTLAHHWRNMVRRMGGDLALFSNYGLEDSEEMLEYQDWYDVAEAQGSICCWDEAHTAFDSRKSTSSQGTNGSQLMMYTRKMKSVQLYCSPSIRNVDTRLRNIIEVLISVRKHGKGMKVQFQDYQTGEFMRETYVSPALKRMMFKQKLYDTHAMVNLFPLPKTDREAQKFFQELKQRHDNSRQSNYQKSQEVIKHDTSSSRESIQVVTS
ncbi:hypothetical protein U3A55_02340 [Salarchaeum sp. III]|uniref:hypothetical protein n=1 Tax=Salarchaeum sp. III TaxID=3107927 RepID=UPI002EDB4ED7